MESRMETKPGLTATGIGAKEIFSKYGALISLLVLLVFNCFFTTNFAKWTTIRILIIQATPIILLSFGMTMVIATGGIDISVGSVMAITSMAMSKILAQGYILPAILVAIALSLVCGFLSGTMVSKFYLLPMVATLSMQYMLRGIAKLLNGGAPLSYRNEAFSKAFRYYFFGEIPMQLLVVVVAAVCMYLVVNKMKFGMRVEGYGDNALAAGIVGIDTVKLVTMCYMISGLFSCLSAIMETGMATASDPSTMGYQYEVDAVAATVVGGTPITGGKPNVVGTLCGAILLRLITTMVNMNNIPYSASLMIKTAIIIVAVYVYKRCSKR